jgi:hypothetical protein
LDTRGIEEKLADPQRSVWERIKLPHALPIFAAFCFFFTAVRSATPCD